MPRGHLGKLPSLQAIGKSVGVDLEEPPESSFDTSEYDAFYAASVPLHDAEDTYFYEVGHGKQTAEVLDQTFKTVQPGDHVCKRFPESASSFLHCRNAVQVGSKYLQLRQLLEMRARLQLVRDYSSRINAAAMFVKDLEVVAREEWRVWHAICHEELQAPPLSKLECLSSICEDLRVHMNHWNSVKQLIHTDRWLERLLPSLALQMDGVRRKLYYLRDSAIWWIDRLIRVGLQVLAHTDLEKLSQDSLWSITRGLEDFNSIVTAIRFENAQETLSLSPALTSLNQSQCSLLTPADAVVMNSYKNIGESIKPIPFIRVLHILANERAKYVAIMTHRIITANDTLHILIGSNKIREYAWHETAHSDKSKLPTANGVAANTSDYHSATTESHSSMASTVFRVGDIIPPDVSRYVVPINEFSHREQEFASKFLQIVCDSTGLLKKSVRSKEDGSTSNRQRKTVSWGDVADNSVKSQLNHRYLELLWHYYSSHLFDFFHDLLWGGSDIVKGQLGHVILCPDTVVMVCVRMMQQVCLKDVMPSGTVTSLASIAWRLEVSAAWAAWQNVLSCALASQSTDKCTATPLADGEYSSRTGRLFRDAFHPLLAILRLLEARGGLAETGGRGANGLVVGGKAPPLTLLLPTLQRLVTTSELALAWCNGRAYHFLASWSLAPFLLITQSDFKMLSDEMQCAVHCSQRMCSDTTPGTTQVEAQMQAQIQMLVNQLHNISAQLQTLSGALVKAFSEKCKAQATEFLEEALPLGKFWKRKVVQDLPSEPNAYVEQALDLLIEPVVSGVSKLRATAQLSAISMAVTALGEAWAEYILKQKIRFSLFGAYQLHQDFLFVHTWLDGALQNPEVKQSILALDIFKYLNGIAELLKRQPRGRSRSRSAANQKAYVHNDDISSCLDCGSSSSRSPSQQSFHEARGNGRSPDRQTEYQVPQMEQWLALRVHGGARQWPRLPSCFNATQP